MKNNLREEKTLSSLSDYALHELTCREWEVLLLLAKDLQNDELAWQLNITAKSVKTYRTRIGRKLLIPGRERLDRFARKNRELLQNKYIQLYPVLYQAPKVYDLFE